MVEDGRNGWGREAPQQVPSWDPELAQLITWFQSVTLPQEPFELIPGVTVTEPALAYAALRASIAIGPDGARARSGALREELRQLRAVWERRRNG
jgi:hypothetical protein